MNNFHQSNHNISNITCLCRYVPLLSNYHVNIKNLYKHKPEHQFNTKRVVSSLTRNTQPQEDNYKIKDELLHYSLCSYNHSYIHCKRKLSI